MVLWMAELSYDSFSAVSAPFRSEHLDHCRRCLELWLSEYLLHHQVTTCFFFLPHQVPCNRAVSHFNRFLLRLGYQLSCLTWFQHFEWWFDASKSNGTCPSCCQRANKWHTQWCKVLRHQDKIGIRKQRIRSIHLGCTKLHHPTNIYIYIYM